MDAYYVRVYVLRDGSQVVAPGMYETEEQAANDLNKFNPSRRIVCGAGADDLLHAVYAKVEKRYSPTPIWSVSQHDLSPANRGGEYVVKVSFDKSQLASQLRDLADTLSPRNGEGNGSALKVSD
ncbi:hypothetical protein Alches_18410 [Alicyclobacillus hesperidum subsp. aegles]|uniref:hypothetical protein n=1 Tax=Alicyclobacillus hesperidum TaxID=89784 RepID=UPI00222D3C57|nr:hypothetical protein [Alicyclobacillus hesperidum]GLG01801.1 hypothetical protein Alches_18410 [Alicyclobacillus hesperidum subsp. aegles]